MRNTIQYIFLGFLISEERANQIISRDKYPMIQTHKFITKFTQALEINNPVGIEYVSAVPISLFPKNKSIFIKKKTYKYLVNNKEVSINEIPFINLNFIRVLTRLMSSLLMVLKLLAKNSRSVEGLIVYSVHLPFLITGVLLSKLFKVKLICVWTDPPSVHNSNNILIKFIRSIELSISKYLMKKTDKVIALTKHLAQDFAPGKPYLVVEGLIDIKTISVQTNSIGSSNIVIFSYAGTISKQYGLDQLVQAFAIIDDPNIVLNIYGVGEYSNEIIKIAKFHPNIHYYGYIDYKEIPDVLSQADFLINPRGNYQYFSKYSFPSKILEYMLTGRPTITPYLDGMPNEYKDYIIELDNNDYMTIMQKIIEVARWTKTQKDEFGHRAMQFASSKSIENFSSKIQAFIMK